MHPGSVLLNQSMRDYAKDHGPYDATQSAIVTGGSWCTSAERSCQAPEDAELCEVSIDLQATCTDDSAVGYYCRKCDDTFCSCDGVHSICMAGPGQKTCSTTQQSWEQVTSARKTAHHLDTLRAAQLIVSRKTIPQTVFSDNGYESRICRDKDLIVTPPGPWPEDMIKAHVPSVPLTCSTADSNATCASMSAHPHLLAGARAAYRRVSGRRDVPRTSHWLAIAC